MNKLLISLFLLCIGCTALMTEDGRRRLEERQKEREARRNEKEKLVRLAQKYGYCGSLSYSEMNLPDDTKEWARKLFNGEIAPAEQECQLCYDYEMEQNGDWQNFTRYILIKWANENLTKWNRGFKEQFAYQRSFKPKRVLEYNLNERYVIGWPPVEEMDLADGSEDLMIICPLNQAGRVGSRKCSGVVRLPKPFEGFVNANITLNDDGRIRSVGLRKKCVNATSREQLVVEAKSIWKSLENQYQIKATWIRFDGWCFENDSFKMHLGFVVGNAKEPSEIVLQFFCHA